MSDDGGYVYPQADAWNELKGGITRRDWTAVMVLKAMMDSPMSRNCPPAKFSLVLPQLAYELADALIAEGGKGE